MAAIDFKPLANTTVIVVASAYAVLLPAALFAGVYGIFLTAALLLSLWRYSYAVLRHVARGWRHFPPPDVDSMNPFGDVAVVFHYVFFGLLTVLLVTTPFIADPVRVLALLVVAFVFPASAAVMGMTNSLAAALNPASVWTIARELAERCRKLSSQFAPPAVFTAELAAYARSLGRHRSADELTALAAASTARSPDVSPRAPVP
jgi:hypothetical protein